MADALKDIEVAILESDEFQFKRPDGVAVELVVTLMDMQSDTIAVSKMVREHGAQPFGMLFFKSASLPTKTCDLGALRRRATDHAS